jgi:hypothetical protein
MPTATAIAAVLDVFSGRPNPTVTLASSVVSDLRRRLAKLPSAPPEDPPPLGYRGVVVVEPGKETRVYHGVVTVSDGTSTRYLTDDADIEALLLREVASPTTVDTLKQIAVAELEALRLSVVGVGSPSLEESVKQAQAELNAGRMSVACLSIGTFVALVRFESQRRSITTALARKLTDDALRIRSLLGCR